MEPQELVQLYVSLKGAEPHTVERLKGEGSNRRYYRLADAHGDTLIGVVGTSATENEAFYQLSEAFAQRQLPVPAVYSISHDHNCYLQQDLGSTSLAAFLQAHKDQTGQYDAGAEAMLTRVITDLPRFQFEAADEYVYHLCYPMPHMDDQSVQFDLNYFKYCYLKLTGIEFNEISLEADFQRFKHDLLAVGEVGFMYRDFQARNVMLFHDQPRYIDYQGGRRGPIYYDVASFLWQASAAYPQALRERLAEVYRQAVQTYMPLDAELFRQRLQLFVLFRTLQVLGAYGFRGLWEKKQHFIDSIPQALQNLSECIRQGSCDTYPYLKEVAQQLIASSPIGFADSSSFSTPLQVDVWSFSFKKGIPDDPSGNGGGYVFDCRSTHNPGRYEAYKTLSGLDQPVIDFLEQDGEILAFLDSIYRLADFHVQRYIERGFTHLQFAFGCTGGQHRSVYSAQHLAEHLHQRFPNIEIHLTHREQNIRDVFNVKRETF